jgi:hypothetical protein
MLLGGLRWMLAEQGLNRELRAWWEPFEWNLMMFVGL